MRHLVKGRKLGRTASHRKATLQALSVALIKEHRIVTTLAKAKELRSYIEPLITRAKEDTSHNRRQVFSNLKSKQAVTHLFDEVARKAKDRPGGYTRVLKLGTRSGDGSKMAMIELVDYNDIKPEDAAKKKRTRRAGKSKTSSSGEKAQKDSGKKAASAKKSEKKPESESESKAEAKTEAEGKAGVSDSESADTSEDSEDKK